MKLIKQSSRASPKISLVLIDWSVRESFHLLHYLEKQTLYRERFEIIIVEYYSYISDAIKQFETEVDTWILLEMPTECYYHKHLMYNVGIFFSQGDIVVICDSDVMVKPSFLESIFVEFKKNSHIILHLDQFRNNRKDLYPFCYPSFEEVLGDGCINHLNKKTVGLTLIKDALHCRNYGACLCAKREDLINIGGADEHIDFVGYICGPYDLTFRLVNLGKQEIWHPDEFLYHTWHPGEAGVNNYLGPHDGLHLSTTALESIHSSRIFPNVINRAIVALMNNRNISNSQLESLLISAETFSVTKRFFLESHKAIELGERTYSQFIYLGFLIIRKNNLYRAIPLLDILCSESLLIENQDISILKRIIRQRNLTSRFASYPFFLAFYISHFIKIYLKITKSKFTKFFFLQNWSVGLHSEVVSKKKGIKVFRSIFNLHKNINGLTKKIIKEFLKSVHKSKLHLNWLTGALLNFEIIDKKKIKTVFLLTDSLLDCLIIYFFILCKHKKLIKIKKVKNPDILSSLFKKIYARENINYFVISSQCYLQYRLLFLDHSIQHPEMHILIL